MNPVSHILDMVPNTSHLHIVETGCANSLDIANWVSFHPDNCTFVSIDLDWQLQAATHKKLEDVGLAHLCVFLTQAPTKYLSARTWLDVAFLNPPDLQSGLEEFCFAISAGASLVAIRDYQTRAVVAVTKGRSLGWKVSFEGPFSILRRP